MAYLQKLIPWKCEAWPHCSNDATHGLIVVDKDGNGERCGNYCWEHATVTLEQRRKREAQEDSPGGSGG